MPFFGTLFEILSETKHTVYKQNSMDTDGIPLRPKKSCLLFEHLNHHESEEKAIAIKDIIGIIDELGMWIR